MTALDWSIDGQHWPNREASRFVEAGGLRWHVQELGNGPVLILIHGTAAATHSWRGLLPILSKQYRVIAMDLPGHGFTQAPKTHAITLPGMASAIAALMTELNVSPALAVGHSAGAAILCHMAHTNAISCPIVSINGALLPWRGFVTQYFPYMAKLLFVNPFVPGFFAWRAKDLNTIRKLIAETGSAIDEDGLAQYALLFRNTTHVAAALAMMANWDLESLKTALPQIGVPLTLIAATGDKAIPVETALAVRDLVPASRVELVRGLGHLCHEENPALIADLVAKVADQTSLLRDI